MPTLIGPLIVAVMLLAPQLAAAECAWVLWEKTTYASEAAKLLHRTGNEPYVVWTRPEILKTQPVCSAALTKLWRERQRADVLAPLIEKTETEPRRVTTIWKQDGYTMWEFECLPDTIDPRGPKGGGR